MKWSQTIVDTRWRDVTSGNVISGRHRHSSKYDFDDGDSASLIGCGLFKSYKRLRLPNWQHLPIEVLRLMCVDEGLNEPFSYKLDARLPSKPLRPAGALSGGFWGTLVGMIFMMPLFGAALGAASGALGGALTDNGINDDSSKELAASLQPGNAALFVEIKKMTGDKVLEVIKGTGGVILKTSLDHTKEQALREAIAATSPVLAAGSPTSSPSTIGHPKCWPESSD